MSKSTNVSQITGQEQPKPITQTANITDNHSISNFAVTMFCGSFILGVIIAGLFKNKKEKEFDNAMNALATVNKTIKDKGGVKSCDKCSCKFFEKINKNLIDLKKDQIPSKELLRELKHANKNINEALAKVDKNV